MNENLKSSEDIKENLSDKNDDEIKDEIESIEVKKTASGAVESIG